MLFSTPQLIRASRTRSGRTSAVMISSTRPVVPCARMLPSKLTIMPSPIESNEPSEPHMQTLAVTIRFWNGLAWMVKRQRRAVGPLDHGNADVAGLPRLDRNPGVELAVVELDLALIVDDQAGIVG